MVFDATITLGTVIQTILVVAGGFTFLITMGNAVKTLGTDVVDLKQDIKKLNENVIQIAVQNTRINRLEEDIRDLKHGKGFVVEG